jgi:lysozyme
MRRTKMEAKMEEVRRTQTCAEMVKLFEGLKLEPYVCPGGELTIGYGHVVRKSEVFPVSGISTADADAMLAKDLDFYESGVTQLLNRIGPKPQHWELDALTSFAFNVGLRALQESTLLKKYLAWDARGAAQEFARWRFSQGVELPGLVKRRRAEAVRFLGGDFPLVASCYHGGVE